MTMISKEQQDRILTAAMRDLDIASDADRQTVRLAILGATQQPHNLVSLMGVFHTILANVRAELAVIGFEAIDDGGSPSSSRH